MRHVGLRREHELVALPPELALQAQVADFVVKRVDVIRLDGVPFAEGHRLRDAPRAEHGLQVLIVFELLNDLLLPRLQHAVVPLRDLPSQLCIVRLLIVEAFDQQVVPQPLFDR